MINEAEESEEASSESDDVHRDMVDIKLLILGIAKKMKSFEKDLRIIKRN